MINITKLFNPDGSEAAPTELPMVPLRDMVVFPHMISPIFVGRESSIKALSEAMARDKMIFLVTQQAPETLKPKMNDIYSVGTQAKINQLLRLPDGTVKVLVEGQSRGKITRLRNMDGYVSAEFLPLADEPHACVPYQGIGAYPGGGI